jgi:hypothetical protein
MPFRVFSIPNELYGCSGPLRVAVGFVVSNVAHSLLLSQDIREGRIKGYVCRLFIIISVACPFLSFEDVGEIWGKGHVC